MTNDLTKKVISYLPTLSSIEYSTLLQHLKDIGIKKTEANKQLILFKRLIFNTFWKHVLNSFILCWNRGVELYVIGQPEKKIFYPCVALHLGDGPAQKEGCGIM